MGLPPAGGNRGQSVGEGYSGRATRRCASVARLTPPTVPPDLERVKKPQFRFWVNGTLTARHIRASLTHMKSARPMARPYRMVARAESAAATADRIMDAAVTLFWQQPAAQIRLDQVAGQAGVTVQTVIRRFGTKEDLFAATVRREQARVRQQRDDITPGDVPGAVANLVAHYEELGDRVLRLLAEEQAVPAIKAITDDGRRLHQDWCARAFAPFLASLDDATRKRRFAQFVAICDVYTWKLLRRDLGLSPAQTRLALEEMLTPLT